MTATTATAATDTATDTGNDSQHDVIVLGGGLAGLTLALQLRQRFPGIDVLVLERRSHPVPDAAHKVGESSVEIGAHYFQTVLGLEQHLVDKQLKKFGFRFFFSEGAHDIAAVTELGASRPLPVASWQIDRGIFENFLGDEVKRRGVRFVDDAMVRKLHLSKAERGSAQPPHCVTWQRNGQALQSAQARWVVDASGRAGLIKRQLGLARPQAQHPHQCHAVWFRIGERMRVDDWSADADWQARCTTPTRWLSTNHMVGAGYWVWLIPLASGSHSVGIVADPRWHALDTMNTFELAMQWLQTWQPLVYKDLAAKRDKLQDFAFFRSFSYDCEQVFSADRWALTGEAGRFLDPFYSPGSDFIAIGNTYITELIARDRANQPLSAHVQIYEQVFRSFFDSTLALYVDQYGLFGDPEVLPYKVLWDYTYYWGVLAPLFFQNRLTDMVALAQLRDETASCQPLNVAVQTFLRAWSQHSHKANPPVMLDQASIPWFAELNRSLLDTMDGPAFRLRLRASAKLLRMLATELLDHACGLYPALASAQDCSTLRQALADAGGALRETGQTGQARQTQQTQQTQQTLMLFGGVARAAVAQAPAETLADAVA